MNFENGMTSFQIKKNWCNGVKLADILALLWSKSFAELMTRPENEETQGVDNVHIVL